MPVPPATNFLFSSIGACNCNTNTCFIKITVGGCNGANIGSGIPVRIRASSGGTILDSGTTNSSGQVTLAIPGPSGTYWVEADGTSHSSGRFADFAASRSLTCGTSGSPGTLTVTLKAATGYSCGGAPACLLPCKNTLICTFSIAGAVTCTSTGGTAPWLGNLVFGGNTYPITLQPSSVSVGTGTPANPAGAPCSCTGGAVLTCPPSYNFTCNFGGTCLTVLGTPTVTE